MSGFVKAEQLKDAFGKYSELKQHAAVAERFGVLFDLCRRIAGHPRHLGTHSSGLVLGGVPLSTINVVTPSARGVLPIIMLDKDDVETAGAVKLDILSLPILTVVRDAERDIKRSDPSFKYDDIPREDRSVYQMLWAGQNMGLFQLGSPAQAALATQLHPRDFEDLVASIGLIRPGPVRSNAVQRYVSARNGWSRIEVLHPALHPILDRTYGVACFQEQIALIIAAMMGIPDAEADAWRKALAKHAKRGTMDQAREEFVRRSMQRHRDLPLANAHRLMDELEGWSSLGFVEGHSASFALTAQKTAFLMHHYPAEYYAALIGNQPCGFYPPQSLAAEARRRGVPIRPVDINLSQDTCVTEDDGRAIRLGLRLVEHLRQADIDAILSARQEAGGRFASLLDFCVRVPLHVNRLENLILCGAFDLLHDHRRGMLWRLDETLRIAARMRADARDERQRILDLKYVGEMATPIAWDIYDMTDWEAMIWEWRTTGVTSSCHPFTYVREALTERGILSAHEAMEQPHGTRVTVAGLNIRPHRPPAKKEGVKLLFATIEDESDYLQVGCFGEAIEQCTPVFLLCPIVKVTGMIRRRGMGASMIVEKAEPINTRSMVNSRAAEELLTAPPQRSASAR